MATLRRFSDHKDAGKPYELGHDHIAVRLGTSLFRERRLVSPGFSKAPPLKSGEYSRKIGATVMKGKWKSAPIYTLTLEERASCPRSCQHWRDCYGNKVHWPDRFLHDDTLVPRLEAQLTSLAATSKMFVVRLHVLGDFYSASYVRQWGEWLKQFPGLRIYGYTAWPEASEIGRAVKAITDKQWHRFAIRFSNSGADSRSTVTLYEPDVSGVIDGAIVCPAQTYKSECCATCTLCWQTEQPIAFLSH